MTSVSTNVKSIVPRPRVPEVLFSRDLTETASSESETQGQSSGQEKTGATKVSEDAETGNRARKASGTQGKSIIAHMWEYPLGPLYLHGIPIIFYQDRINL